MKAFVSYSHQDEQYVKTLRKHLALIEREGLIDFWYDREILAGAVLDSDIEEQLETCDLFLAIISPDFISSNYCYEVETSRALARHLEGTMRLVPIIVEPCEWKRTPLKDLKGLPKDNKPVSDWKNPNTAFLDIATELRRILEAKRQTNPTTATLEIHAEKSVVKTPRVKRTFDAIDRADFNSNSFIEIREYFIQSAEELNKIDGIKCRIEKYSETSFGGRVINNQYQHGDSGITVHMSNGSRGFGDIYFSGAEHANPDTANGWYNIEATDYELLYRGNGMLQIYSNEEFIGTANDVARKLWSDFMQSAGIEYD
jgi:hypothetical protein